LREPCLGSVLIETTAHNESATVPAASQVEHSVCLRFGFYPLLDRGKGRIDDVQVRKLISIELFCDVAESFLRVVVAHVIKCVQRRQSHSYPVRPPHFPHRVDHLHQQPRTILYRPAIAIGPPVGAGIYELVKKIAVRGVNLDTIEPGRESILASARIAALCKASPLSAKTAA